MGVVYMQLIGENVCHKIYGVGTVIEQSSTMITVHFSSKDAKFPYPSPNTFKKFLTAENSDVQAAILDEFARAEEEAARKRAEEEARKKAEEERRAEEKRKAFHLQNCSKCIYRYSKKSETGSSGLRNCITNIQLPMQALTHAMKFPELLPLLSASTCF
jgi:hypothetical protein